MRFQRVRLKFTLCVLCCISLKNAFAETYLQYEKQAFFLRSSVQNCFFAIAVLNPQPKNDSETVELLLGEFSLLPA